jgi:hypothetical protein
VISGIAVANLYGVFGASRWAPWLRRQTTPAATSHGQGGRLHVWRSEVVPRHGSDAREMFDKVTKGSLGGKAGDKPHQDWEVKGEYVDPPKKGVVGIPYPGQVR